MWKNCLKQIQNKPLGNPINTKSDIQSEVTHRSIHKCETRRVPPHRWISLSFSSSLSSSASTWCSSSTPSIRWDTSLSWSIADIVHFTEEEKEEGDSEEDGSEEEELPPKKSAPYKLLAKKKKKKESSEEEDD